MAKINLLPWREERRQELQKEFLVILGGVAVIAFGLVFLMDRSVNSAIAEQQARNRYIQSNIDDLSVQVKEIKELSNKKQELLDRMTVIQELQGNRPIIVRIFDELVRTLPDGVFYEGLSRTGSTIQLSGTAESNSRISSLMRKLNMSDWFASPNLSDVTAKPEFGEQSSGFSLSFSISTPSTDLQEGE